MNTSLSDQQARLIDQFGDILVNTGGNDPRDLISDLATDKNMMSTNIVRFILAAGVSSQVALLERMEKEALLLPKTPDHPSVHCDRATDGTCSRHGGRMSSLVACQTIGVLAEVRAERGRQFDRYGTNEGLEDGTGTASRWLAPVSDKPAVSVERLFREDYEAHEKATGAPTWMHLIREEVAEVFVENDPSRLREELLQVAALAVSWVEKIDARGVEK